MERLSEELLNVWLKVSTAISNDRLTSDMPYNEALICNILYRNQISNPDLRFTATDLCVETKMLKSQMNRTLTAMEEKKLIVRERSIEDKRNVWIVLNNAQIEVYLKQHTKVMQLVDSIVDRLGEDKTGQVITLLQEISKIADEVIE